MAVVQSTHFEALGAQEDVAATAEIAPGKSIGGGAVDEAGALLDNCTWLWGAHARAVVTEVEYYGEQAPQASICTETSTSYVEHLDLEIDMHPGRQGLTVSLDVGYTGTGSGDIRLTVVRRDTGATLATATGATLGAPAQEQFDIALTGITQTACRLLVEAKVTTDGTITVWGVRGTEDAATLSVEPAGFDWRQVDQTAAAAREQLHAALLQRLERNLRTTQQALTQRTGMGWDVAARPTVACHQQVAWVLRVLRLDDDATQWAEVIRHKVTEADVHLELIILSRHGIRRSTETTISDTGAYVSTELTVDVTGWAGLPVAMFIGVRSDVGGAVGTTPNVTGNQMRSLAVELGGAHGLTFTAGDRWVLAVIDPLAGTLYSDEGGAPEPRTVMREPIAGVSTDRCWCWPPIPGGTNPWEMASYRHEVDELGRTEIASISGRVSAVASWPSGRAGLRPGDPPAAFSIGQLYSRARELYRKRSRICHSGPVPDPLQVDAQGPEQVTEWGVIRKLSDQWQVVGSALVGNVDHTESQLDGASTIRSVYDCMAMLALPWTARQGLVDLNVRVRLLSFSGGSWSANIVTRTITVRMPTFRASVDGQRNVQSVGSLYAFGVQEAGQVGAHRLRGAYPVDALTNATGLQIVELQIDETQTAADYRLALLEVQAPQSGGGDPPATVDGRPLTPAAPRPTCMVYCPTWTVTEARGW